MFIKKVLSKSGKHYNHLVGTITEELHQADKIVIGAGAGLSASAGLNYGDPELFRKRYRPFLKKGHHTIADAIASYWHLTKENATSYWGFWGNHIHNIYYHPAQLETYKMLYDVIGEKDYFVITTNVDDQFYRGGYDPERVFAMQGSYGKFQCQYACHDTLYDNEEMVKVMLESFDSDTLTVKEEHVPTCPECGGLLCPNLRVDHFFVETSSMDKREHYLKFLSQSYDKVLFLELGVGYNTPVIIRYPFEEMTKSFDNATLIRVNKTYPGTPDRIKKKSIITKVDIHDLLEDIQKCRER